MIAEAELLNEQKLDPFPGFYTHICARTQMEHHLEFHTKWNFCAFAILTTTVMFLMGKIYFTECFLNMEQSPVYEQSHIFNVNHPKVFIYIYKLLRISQTKKLYFCVRVLWATCFDSYRVIFGPFKN